MVTVLLAVVVFVVVKWARLLLLVGFGVVGTGMIIGVLLVVLLV